MLQDNYDDEDVELVINKTDVDGDGPENELPGSDFVAFAEPDVEEDEETEK